MKQFSLTFGYIFTALRLNFATLRHFMTLYATLRHFTLLDATLCTFAPLYATLLFLGTVVIAVRCCGPGSMIYQNNRNNQNPGITTEIPEQPTIYRNNQKKIPKYPLFPKFYNKIHEKRIITLILYIIY